MIRKFLLPILAVGFFSSISPGGSPRAKPVTFEELREFVRAALKQEKLGLLATQPLKYAEFDKSYFLDGPLVEFQMDLPWAGPIRHLLKIEIARRARSLPLPDKEWQAHLDGLEDWVAKEAAWIRVHLKDKRKVSDKKLDDALLAYEGFFASSLTRPIEQAAKAKGLRPWGNKLPEGTDRIELIDNIKKGTERFVVRVFSDPPDASIHYLPEFEYRFKERFGHIQDATNWREVADNRLLLSGNYRFLVRWPSRNKTTGTIEIVRDTSLVLRP